MHVIIGVLGSIITILILLNRLAEAGIDLGGLNPFLWKRRRQWKQKNMVTVNLIRSQVNCHRNSLKS